MRSVTLRESTYAGLTVLGLLPPDGCFGTGGAGRHRTLPPSASSSVYDVSGLVSRGAAFSTFCAVPFVISGAVAGRCSLATVGFGGPRPSPAAVGFDWVSADFMHGSGRLTGARAATFDAGTAEKEGPLEPAEELPQLAPALTLESAARVRGGPQRVSGAAGLAPSDVPSRGCSASWLG